jgi:KUP system potassium uptake protein
LILCYCGQGAVLLNPTIYSDLLRENPFFALAPTQYVRVVLVFLATGATLIASQSVVSGAFAVVDQAISLDMW